MKRLVSFRVSSERSLLGLHRQSRVAGFSYLEISLSLILLSLLGYFALTESINNSKKSLAQIEAGQLNRLATALGAYAAMYRDQLPVNSVTITRRDTGGAYSFVASVPSASTPEGSKLSPTVDQLIALGFLPVGTKNFPLTSSGKFISRLTLIPSVADCRARPNNCQIHGYVAIDQPLTTNPSVTPIVSDPDLVGHMMTFMGSEGFATLEAGANAVATNGNFTQQLDLNGDGAGNPLPTGADSLQAGLVGIRIGAFTDRRSLTAGVDFCARPADLFEWTQGSLPIVNNSPSATNCSGRLESDVSVGNTGQIFDLTKSAANEKTGYAIVRCERQTDGTALLVIQAGASCG